MTTNGQLKSSASPAQPKQAEKQAPVPTQIGWLFVQQYYTFLNESPERLHLFYNTNSVWTHGKEAENCPSIIGQKAISKAIQALDLQNCQVFVSSVDSQASMSGGVIVQVLGEMSNKDDVCHKFSQTFFLAEQPEGYYVLNDIFRFLKEDIDVNGVGGGSSSDPNGNWQETNRDHVFNYQEKATHAAAVAPAVASAPSKTQYNAPTPSSKPAATTAAPAKQVVEEATAATSAPVKHASKNTAAPTPAAEPAAKSSTVQAAPVKPLAPQPSVAQQAAPPAKQAPQTAPSSDKAGVSSVSSEHAKPQRPSSPSKKPSAPAAPTAWSRIVSSPSDAGSAAAAPQSAGPIHSHSASAASSTPSALPSRNGGGSQKSSQGQPKQAPKPKEDNSITSDGFQNVPTRQRLDRRPTEEKEKSTIYLRSVPDHVEKQSIHDAFMKAGQVLNVDMPPGKQIAFVTFKTPESAQACIGKSFSVVSSTTGKEINLLAEERKKPQNSNGGSGGKGRGVENNSRGGSGAGFRGRGGRGKPSN